MTRALTEHFSWVEVTRSQTAARLGIDNQVPAALEPNVELTAAMLEDVRALLKVPLRITSWYRSWALNTAIGGSRTSAHPKGLAVDFDPVGMTHEEAMQRIADADYAFDQLILEQTKSGAEWIHLGLSLLTPRRQVMGASGATLGGAMRYRTLAN